MYVWPWRLLRGASEKPQLVNRVVSGGAALSGLEQSVATSGGGLWTLDLTGISLRTPDQIRCARAWSAYLDGGAQKVVVPFFDLGQAPRPYTAGKPALPGTPEPSDDYFAQEPGFGERLITAELWFDAALRATVLNIKVQVGLPLVGGEHFSINHTTKGWRTYRVARANPALDQVQSIEVRPPIREFARNGTSMEFDVPRTVMALDPSKASDLEPDLNLNRFATVNASFREVF